MIRAAAIALLVAIAAPAAAQVTGSLPSRPVPTLRAAVTVTSDLVRIGDLVDNAGPAANAAIFRAPDLGTTGTVPVAQVLDAIRTQHLFLVDTGNLTDVAVTRAGRAIGQKEVEERILRAFANRPNVGDARNLAITLDRDVRPVVIDPAASGDLLIVKSSFDQRSGRFDVVLELPSIPGGRGVQQRYTGAVTDTVEVAIVARPIGRGEIVRNSDLMIERRPRAELTGELITKFDDAIGRATRQPLRAGNPLRRTDLMKPELVHRDETVTLTYKAPGIVLTIRGKALDTGAEGDLVRVLNIQSKRPVQGYVSGPGHVTVPAATAAVTNTFASTAPSDRPISE